MIQLRDRSNQAVWSWCDGSEASALERIRETALIEASSRFVPAHGMRWYGSIEVQCGQKGSAITEKDLQYNAEHRWFGVRTGQAPLKPIADPSWIFETEWRQVIFTVDSPTDRDEMKGKIAKAIERLAKDFQGKFPDGGFLSRVKSARFYLPPGTVRFNLDGDMQPEFGAHASAMS